MIAHLNVQFAVSSVLPCHTLPTAVSDELCPFLKMFPFGVVRIRSPMPPPFTTRLRLIDIA